jgi:hypothetical protein
VGLERGPLSLVTTTEELLGRKSSGFGLETREYVVRIRHADHVAPSNPKKFALTVTKWSFFLVSYKNVNALWLEGIETELDNSIAEIRGLTPRANYTDRATTAYRRS